MFRALLAKLIEEPEEKQTFDRLLEMAEKFCCKTRIKYHRFHKRVT